MLQDEVSRNHCTSRSTLTPSPHSWQMNASIMVKLGKYSALRSVGSECCKSPRLRVPPIYGRRGQWETVSITAPQELHLRSAISPRSSTMMQPSQSAPVATSCGMIR